MKALAVEFIILFVAVLVGLALFAFMAFGMLELILWNTVIGSIIVWGVAGIFWGTVYVKYNYKKDREQEVDTTEPTC